MAEKSITPEELYATHSAGGRQSGEKSNAQESWKYSKDPLDHFEYPSERLRKEKERQVQRAKRRK